MKTTFNEAWGQFSDISGYEPEQEPEPVICSYCGERCETEEFIIYTMIEKGTGRKHYENVCTDCQDEYFSTFPERKC